MKTYLWDINQITMHHFVIILIILLCHVGTTAQQTIIHCGKLIDVEKGVVNEKMSIVVIGGLISKVEKGYLSTATGDKLIDLKNKTVMPGLMDMHVHKGHE